MLALSEFPSQLVLTRKTILFYPMSNKSIFISKAKKLNLSSFFV